MTLEPAEDDEDVFGEVWPLIVEWRELKAVHPDEGKSLSWLLTEERFLALELTLLEEHGLTLPPATFPLRGFDRNGQVNWRKTALSDTRRALRKRESSALTDLRSFVEIARRVVPVRLPVNFREVL